MVGHGWAGFALISPQHPRKWGTQLGSKVELDLFIQGLSVDSLVFAPPAIKPTVAVEDL